jgi:uncharacterized Zn finger protein (UPF0148 family)
MSDFDKEAEREKLREKYEQEQREREATEKMSELLLQGATMTNAHCSDCGDPIFRYEGQEFCASCEKAVDRGGEDADDGQDEAESDASEGSEDAENIEVTSPDDSARVAFGGENVDAEGNGEQSPDPNQQPAGPQQRSAGSQSADSPHQQSTPTHQQSPGSQHSPSQPSGQRQPTQAVPGVDPGEGGAERRSGNSRAASQPDGDVSAARESLVRTLTRFSQQAEATEDPQRAQEYLAAARDAAEALSALRR